MLHGLTPPRVLLIEHDEDIRTLVSGLLDFEVVEASTGGDGLRLAFASPSSLVLLDRNLPDQDGLAVEAEPDQFASAQGLAACASKCKSDEVKQVNDGKSNTGSFRRAELLGT